MCEKFSSSFNEKINKAKAKVLLLRAQLAPFSQDPNPESTKSDPVLDVIAESPVSECRN
jgi:hypothetical protein